MNVYEYITLPCTASKTEYPDNTRGKYTTLLPKEYYLQGLWDIGLCEVVLPVPKFSLTDKEESNILFGKGGLTSSMKIDVSSVTELQDLECPRDDAGTKYFHFTIFCGTITLHVPAGNCIQIEGPLGKLLGFTSNQYDGPGQFLAYPKNPVSLAYIYCDLVEYSTVGDSLVPLLRTVFIKDNLKPTYKCFENVHYLPLQNNRFSTVEIVIADDLGKVLEFKEGITYIKLHLRPRK
jgi:hypothetical protein